MADEDRALADLLLPFLATPTCTPNVLELFARMTLAGPCAAPLPAGSSSDAREDDERRGFYLSVGNEAVKFNVLERAGGAVRAWVRPRGEELAEGVHAGDG